MNNENNSALNLPCVDNLVNFEIALVYLSGFGFLSTSAAATAAVDTAVAANDCLSVMYAPHTSHQART